MMRRHPGWLFASWIVSSASAAEIVYVTDLRIYTLLAPCAADALSYDIDLQTFTTRCDQDETKLQSCICSNTGIYDDVTSLIESDVTESCGMFATADVWSASKVIDQYCHPDSTITFETPTTNIVNAYITDLSETQYLAPCAQSGLAGAANGVSTYCPEDASLFAPCLCSKSNVVSIFKSSLSSVVRASCSNGEDVTSARSFYSEFCAMNKGTTSFAAPGGPPGDMSYYITALPAYSALRSCAQSAVSSVVQFQTEWLCPSGPQALASCICLKSGLYYDISSTLTSSVKANCDNTATDDVTSAISVLKYYCSAAENEVVAEVTESIPQTYPTATTGSGSRGSAPEETSTSTGSSDSESSSDGDNGDKGSGGVGQTATIAASVLGGVVGLAIIAAAIFFFRRRSLKRKNATGSAVIAASINNGGDNGGKVELASSPSGTPRPDTAKAVSPDVSTLHPELHDNSLAPGYQSYGRSPQELPSSGSAYQPSPTLRGQPVSEFPANEYGQHGQQGPGWQAGPVDRYELDSSYGRAN